MRWMLLPAGLAACATTPTSEAVSVGPAIFRAVDVHGPDIEVAGFVRLVNASGKADRLMGISCACAERVEIHNTNPEGMHVLPHLDLPAGATTDIRPGGPTHLMLIGTKQGYRAGETVQMTLSFESGASLSAAFTGVDNSAEGWKAAGG